MFIPRVAPTAAKQAGATSQPITEDLIAHDTTGKPSLTDCADVLTLKETASVLRISAYSARQMCREGSLQAVKVGRQWRIPRTWLIRFINDNGGNNA